MDNKLVAIVGPTASGKSALAMHIAQRFNGEIICADSRTVYKGMDIGTAKPTRQDQAKIRHHMLDIVVPNQPFSAAQFKELALAAVTDITSRGRVPLLVGGSGLYIDAILFDYKFGKAADPAMRQSLNNLSIEDLQALCVQKSISLPRNTMNKRHLIRAIELDGFITSDKKLRPNTIVVGITTERSKLKKKIEVRAAEMFSQGVLDEAQQLAKQYGWHNEAMTGNIYRILKEVLEDGLSTQQALQAFIQTDMQLAKRQITWFKRNPYIIWSEDTDQLLKEVERFLR